MDDATIRSGERTRSHDEIDDRARRAARGLRDLGLGEGDAIALLLRNDFAVFEASLAAKRIGAHAVPLNWHAGGDEVGYILRDCGAKALVAHDDLLASLAPRVDLPTFRVDTPPEIRAAYELPEADAGRAGAWDDVVAACMPLDDATSVASPAVIYTSGTTGPPKGVRRAPAPSSKRSERALAVYGLDADPPIVALINGPMYHSVPNAYARLALQAGADIVLEARFEPEDMLGLIQRHGVTHMHIVPAMFIRLLRLPDAVKARYDLSSLRYVIHGAAPCPPKIKAAMIEWWGPVIHEYYGSTETGLLTVHGSAEALSRPGTVGRPLPDVALEIRDAAGDALPPGTVGDIYAKSPATGAFGYIGQEEQRANINRGDMITLGDVGWLDADGYLYLRGRKSEMIRSGGVEISPAEVEAALLDIAGVKDCAVFGLPHDTLGEAVCACVEPLPAIDLGVDDLHAGLASRLEAAKRPRVLEMVVELPREDSGKIFKRKLRDRYLTSSRLKRRAAPRAERGRPRQGLGQGDGLPDRVESDG